MKHKKRLCPTCGDSTLTETTRNLIQLDRCERCNGLWFDGGELEKTKSNMHEHLRCFDLQNLESSRKTVCLGASVLSCPACDHGAMVAVNFSGSQLTLDYCSSCCGTWLDAGELEKLTDYLHALSEKKSISGYVEHVWQEFHELLRSTDTKEDELRDLIVVINLLQLRACSEYPTFVRAVEKLSVGMFVHPGNLLEHSLESVSIVIDAGS